MTKEEHLAICFSGDSGKAALQLLTDFARADTAEFVTDPRLADYLQGRRSVICEIRRILREKGMKDER